MKGLFLRNNVLSYIIQLLNKSAQGNFVAEHFEFLPFYQFPDISIKPENISYFENSRSKTEGLNRQMKIRE